MATEEAMLAEAAPDQVVSALSLSSVTRYHCCRYSQTPVNSRVSLPLLRSIYQKINMIIIATFVSSSTKDLGPCEILTTPPI